MLQPINQIRTWLSGKDARRAVFESHLKGCYKELYQGALRFTRNVDEAEDLLQDAVVRAYRSFEQFEQGTNFRAWMWRIITNLYITDYRRRQKHGPHLSLDVIDGDLWEDTSSNGHSAERVVLEGVFDEELQAALDELPESIRVVMIMTEVDEMAYQDVAEALGIPVGTVRSRLFRGRMMMRERLAETAASRGWPSSG